MRVSGIPTDNFLSDLLKKSVKDAVDEGLLQVDPEPVAAPAPSAHAASSNLMSRNFFNSEYSRSQYLESSIQGLQLESTYASKMSALVSGLSATAALWDDQRIFGDRDHPIENTYINGARLATAADQAAERIKQEETVKSSEDNLQEMKEDVEEKAEEGMGLNEEGIVSELPEIESDEGRREAMAGTEAGAVSIPAAYNRALTTDFSMGNETTTAAVDITV